MFTFRNLIRKACVKFKIHTTFQRLKQFTASTLNLKAGAKEKKIVAEISILNIARGRDVAWASKLIEAKHFGLLQGCTNQEKLYSELK